MNRRNFLSTAVVAPAALSAQQGPPREERIERLTAQPTHAIALNHLGFLPNARKPVVFRLSGQATPREFLLRDIGSPPKPFSLRRPLAKLSSDLGDFLTGDFSEVTREGMYQVTIGEERSVPFFIRPDVWRRTLPKAVSYHKQQRCGVEIPNMHAVCHLDDARRRDTGEHVDTTGGWHDAGDLRKWMSATMMNGLGLLYMARNLGEKWDLAGSGLAPIREEVEWGNRYFLKMQDKDGRVWADVAGGLNGDNSDNHWTDNKIGTDDDRYLNPAKGGRNQSMFVLLQALMSQAFRSTDKPYAQRCLDAAERCWSASTRSGSVLDQGWWTLAAIEMQRATGRAEFQEAAVVHGRQLIDLQTVEFDASQKKVRGYFRTSTKDSSPLVDAVNSGIPGFALLELAMAFPKHADAGRWRDAVKLYIEEYVTPLSALSPYGIMPLGAFKGSPTQEQYRPLAGELTYRYFLPVRKQFWWLGTTSHLESHALLLAQAGKLFNKPAYRQLAYRQLEWVMGVNPFAACLMTGEGMRNPYPHSRYQGLIIGGIMNGIAGNAKDEPVLDMEYGFDWRTTEYWSPHNCYYIWSLSVLES
jgi:hypothetical protein